MSQPAQAAIWQVIARTVKAAAGLDDSGSPIVAVWRNQNVNAPPDPYVGMSLGASITEGFDYVVENVTDDWEQGTAYAVGDRVLNNAGPDTYECTTAGTSSGAGTGPSGTGTGIHDGSVVWSFVAPGSEISITVGGVREVALQLEVWTDAVVEEVGKAAALSILERIISRLRLPTARNALAAVGFTVFDPGPRNWIPSVVTTKFRGRASCDVRSRLPAQALSEYAGFIDSLRVDVAASGAPGGTIDLTVTVP